MVFWVASKAGSCCTQLWLRLTAVSSGIAQIGSVPSENCCKLTQSFPLGIIILLAGEQSQQTFPASEAFLLLACSSLAIIFPQFSGMTLGCTSGAVARGQVQLGAVRLGWTHSDKIGCGQLQGLWLRPTHPKEPL